MSPAIAVAMTLGVVLAVVSLMGARPAAGASKLWSDLDVRLDACSDEAGFSPSEPGLAENALAEGERAWRACAYAAIESLVIPSTNIPDAYRSLIREDKVLTDLIEQGEVTRSQRRTRLDKLVAGIEQSEALAQGGAGRQSSADTAELEGMRDDLRARQQEMRRMREIQSMMAR